MLGYTVSVLALPVFVLNPLIPVVLGLRTTVGSPCTDDCHQTSNETTPADIVCLDSDYNTTITGSNFQKCVECQLRSSYADNYTGETDVLWGLYNLRYAFSTCVFGYPQQVNNISSPCIVACQPLDAALEPGLTTATSDYYSMCLPDIFPDNIVTTCEFCYNLTTNQVYMANFIEALRYNCHFRTSLTDAFAISPTKIFYPSGLPPSVPTSSAASGSSGHRNLIVIIVLPVLVGVILISVVLGCCILVIRQRRKKAKKRQTAHLQALWDHALIHSPGLQTGGGQAFRESTVFASGVYGPSHAFADQQQTPGSSKPGDDHIKITQPVVAGQPSSYYVPPGNI